MSLYADFICGRRRLCIRRLSLTRWPAGNFINHSICHRISDATWHHSGRAWRRTTQLSDRMRVLLSSARIAFRQQMRFHYRRAPSLLMSVVPEDSWTGRQSDTGWKPPHVATSPPMKAWSVDYDVWHRTKRVQKGTIPVNLYVKCTVTGRTKRIANRTASRRIQWPASIMPWSHSHVK